LTTLMFR